MKMTTFVRGAASSRNWKNRMRLLLALIFLKVRGGSNDFPQRSALAGPAGESLRRRRRTGSICAKYHPGNPGKPTPGPHPRRSRMARTHSGGPKVQRGEFGRDVKPPNPVRAVKRTFTEYTYSKNKKTRPRVHALLEEYFQADEDRLGPSAVRGLWGPLTVVLPDFFFYAGRLLPEAGSFRVFRSKTYRALAVNHGIVLGQMDSE